jgi:hypothetical protein
LYTQDISWWIEYLTILSPSKLLFVRVLRVRFCVIIIFCALN